MKKHFFTLVIAALLILLVVAAAQAQTGSQFGPRIPTAYFVTSGTGQSDQGFPPDPYETFSYDLALQEAGIENFNVVYYTSVLPPESYEVPLESVKPLFHHGAVLETIMAKVGGMRGDIVAAGIGRVWAVDEAGKDISGFAAEYVRIYKKNVTREQAEAEAQAGLTVSLNHELSIRGLKQKGEMVFKVAYLKIEKRYGLALAALGFVNFIYPDPLPVKAPGQ